MQTYTFYFADRFSSIQSFEILECEDEEEARQRASELLGREPERLTVEVWAGAEQVCAVDRERPIKPVGVPIARETETRAFSTKVDPVLRSENAPSI